MQLDVTRKLGRRPTPRPLPRPPPPPPPRGPLPSLCPRAGLARPPATASCWLPPSVSSAASKPCLRPGQGTQSRFSRLGPYSPSNMSWVIVASKESRRASHCWSQL
ncbi:hypothetical protein VULLAG_LOCUS12741 [Vulpes lagopus]